jgi:hypothetical protein
MNRLLGLLLVLVALAGCSTVQDWSKYVEERVKEKVLITADSSATVNALRWNGDSWELIEFDVPEGYYILPPLPEILGIR